MKLIATDLDGTLLNDKHEISDANLQAIHKAKENGIQIVVATGRSYEAALKPMQSVGLECPVICMNGAKIHGTNGDVFRSIPLSEETCLRIQRTCQREGLYFEVYTNQGIYSKDRESFIQVIMDIMKTANPEADEADMRKFAEQRFQDEEFRFTDDFDALFADDKIEVYKFLAFSYEEAKTIAVRQAFETETGVILTSSGHDNIEFNHPDAQKGIALKLLADRMDITMDDVMALGDNFNDMSMLEAAGRGVAMGNAADGVKKACKYITKPNTEDGVAHAIEEMLVEVTS